jgi:hypothetical protein
MLRAEALMALCETDDLPMKAEGVKAATEAKPASARVNFIFELKDLLERWKQKNVSEEVEQPSSYLL